MPPLDVIRAITSNAPEMLGWQDRIGAIEPGKFADLVAVAGFSFTTSAAFYTRSCLLGPWREGVLLRIQNVS